MEYRKLGSTDLDVSVVGLGCNNFGWFIDKAASRTVVDAALDAGVTFLDTADSYGASEDILGEILGPRRKQVVLATKFGMKLDEEREGASARYIAEAIEASLKRLRTDWIDLYQLHKPDPETPIEETLGALQALIAQGKARFVGCSNLNAAQLVEARNAADALGFQGFVSTQDELNVLVRKTQLELGEVIGEQGLGLIPYFPLANGVLTGKYRSLDDIPPDGRLSVAAGSIQAYRNAAMLAAAVELKAFAEARGRSLVELAFGWLAAQPAVSSIIAGATRAEQATQNAASAGWRLTDEDIAEIDRIVDSTVGLPKAA